MGVNLLDKNINTIHRSFIHNNEEVGVEINADKTKHMFMSHQQNTGYSHTIKITNESSENVAAFNYLGMTLTNQNCLHKEVNSTLNKYTECLLIYGPGSSIFLFTK